MSSFKVTDQNLAKFVSTFDEKWNKIQGTPYLDELFKQLKSTRMPTSDEAAKEAEEAKTSDEEAKNDKTFI